MLCSITSFTAHAALEASVTRSSLDVFFGLYDHHNSSLINHISSHTPACLSPFVILILLHSTPSPPPPFSCTPASDSSPCSPGSKRPWQWPEQFCRPPSHLPAGPCLPSQGQNAPQHAGRASELGAGMAACCQIALLLLPHWCACCSPCKRVHAWPSESFDHGSVFG